MTAILIILGLYLVWCKPSKTPKSKKDDKGETYNFPNDALQRRDLYNATIQLIIHAENTSWTRIINFLTANSILMLAWATIASQNNDEKYKWVLVVMSLIGFLVSLAWAPFGSRSRRYLRRYVYIAKELENNKLDDEKFYDGPIKEEDKINFHSLEHIFTSHYLTVFVPLLFADAFFFIFLKSLCLF
jgi:multisubunit Na+/H+ antiporter MnhF subunit